MVGHIYSQSCLSSYSLVMTGEWAFKRARWSILERHTGVGSYLPPQKKGKNTKAIIAHTKFSQKLPTSSWLQYCTAANGWKVAQHTRTTIYKNCHPRRRHRRGKTQENKNMKRNTSKTGVKGNRGYNENRAHNTNILATNYHIGIPTMNNGSSSRSPNLHVKHAQNQKQ